MVNVIGFDHVKRCRRFFRILIGQHGLAYFVVKDGRRVIPHERAVAESVAFAADWMALRTGQEPTLATKRVMRRELLGLINGQLESGPLEVMEILNVGAAAASDERTP